MKLFLLFILFSSSVLFGQMSYHPLNSDVYHFLRMAAIKGVVDYNDNIKPIPRLTIAEKLIGMLSNSSKLTEAEAEELDYWLAEFSGELKIIRNDSVVPFSGFYTRQEPSERLNFFHYSDKNFRVTINPILADKYGTIGQNTYSYLQNGFTTHGSYGKEFGFFLRVNDNLEQGAFVKNNKILSRQQGANKLINNRPDDQLEYSTLNGEFTYTWSWGDLSSGKNNISWGSGVDGKLILSDKAPSFPFIKLALNPADWLNFQYIHGWLHSNVIDSGSIRETLVPDRESFSQVEKYIAAHIIRINLIENLSILLGESVIYSTKPEIMYLIPFLFFRFADHYAQDEISNSGDNAQLFTDIAYRIPKYNIELYLTTFIDELSIRNFGLLNGDGSAIAFTLGTILADVPLLNSSITMEYSRINPFVYMNSNNVQLYTNHGYQLGHWIGSNSDELFFSIQKKFIGHWTINAWADIIRKGDKEEPIQQYQLPYPPFLFGESITLREWGIKLKKKFIHDAQIELEFSNSIEYNNETNTYGTFKHLFVNVSIGL